MVDFVTKNGELEVKFAGRMDTKNTLDLELSVYEEVDKHPKDKCVFNLADVDYIASAFLRLCITVAQKVDGRGFTVVSAQSQIKKIFKMAGVERLFKVV